MANLEPLPDLVLNLEDLPDLHNPVQLPVQPVEPVQHVQQVEPVLEA